MKILLVGINAKYIHTSLSIRSLSSYCAGHGYAVPFAEFTINQSADYILSKLYAQNAACYLFSAYIWNITLIQQLAGNLKKILPTALIGVGGPEITYRCQSFLHGQPAFDFAVQGEGEETVRALVGAIEYGQSLQECPGLVVRKPNGQLSQTPAGKPLSMDLLFFPYRDLAHLSNQILYYESSRGCPYACSYCLSSVEKGVRCRALPLVFEDLRRFLDQRVRQVKFVDRTFNYEKHRALAIWKFLADNDNGVTNFHFELAGDLLDTETIGFLSTLRPGFFQFEIGIQSCNPDTLKAIQRRCDLDAVFRNVRALATCGNIHLHLDLIAGLPQEGFDSFSDSFNQVYALKPHQFQLGFLKVLHGSEMKLRAHDWELLYRDTPPYQVLCTKWLAYSELEELGGIEAMVDLYYNSGRFSHILEYIASQFPCAFGFYQKLAYYYKSRQAEGAPISKTGHYDILGGFLLHCGMPLTLKAQWLCKFDVLLHERPRKLPRWVEVDLTQEYREETLAFYRNPHNIRQWLPEYGGMDPKAISRTAHLEIFPFSPITGEKGPLFVLFHYGRRDISGRAATVFFRSIDRNTGTCAEYAKC